MKIISHRGAGGLATENSLKAIMAGVYSGADRVEFDIWTSKDGVAIVSHDPNFRKVAGIKKRIFNMTYAEIKKIRTFDGERILTAHEALSAVGSTPVFIDIHDLYLSSGTKKLLNDFQRSDLWVGSRNHKVIKELGRTYPNLPLFASTVLRPLETVRMIQKHKLHGLCLHYMWFNVFIYLYCKRHSIKLILYTVNNRHLLKHFAKYYRELIITTDYPDRAVEFIRPSDQDILGSSEQRLRPRQ